jgi:hypothetical protein
VLDRRRQGPLTTAALCASALLLAGCGSTVQQQSRAAQVAPGSGDVSAGTPSTGEGVTPVVGGAAGQAPGAISGAPASVGTGTPGVNDGGSGPQVGSPSLSGGSATTRPISVGVVLGDPTKLAAAFGIQAKAQDIFASYKAMFAYLNKRGGFGGRQIRPVYYAIDAASADMNSAIQAACTYVTQDHPVEVVFSIDIGNSHGFAQCVGRKGIPQFDGGQYTADAPDTRLTPNLFTPEAFAHDLTATALIRNAADRGWITNKDTLGVVVMDCPIDNRVYDRQTAPAAKAAGIKVVKASFNCLNGNADIGTAASQIASVVLRFRSEGVTHVTLLSAPEGGATLFFMQAASQQKYYPPYLISSNAFAYNNSGGGGQATWPQDELAKVKGISWSPLLDVGPLAKPDALQAKAQAACNAMDPTQGGAKGSTYPAQATNVFFEECDTILLFQGLLTASQGSAVVSALSSVYAQVTEHRLSAKLTKARFASKGGRRDGAAYITPFSYKASGCRCFSYDGTPVATE